MSDTKTPEPNTKLTIRQRLWGLSITSLVVLAMMFGMFVLLDMLTGSGMLFVFAFGWVAGICNLLMGLYHEPVAVLVGLVALVLAPLALHAFLRRLTGVVPTWWRYKQSEAVVGMCVAFAIAAISMIVFVHEVYWLRHPKEPLTSSVIRRMVTTNRLREIANGVYEFSDAHDNSFPAGCTLLENGNAGHSWMTQLLPYLNEAKRFERIDFAKPWNDPVNAAVFRENNPQAFASHRKLLRDEDGYALTEFAANERVMPFGRAISFADVTDGTSNTLLCGEVRDNPQPWGSPLNGRDPAIGLNTSPHGFGANSSPKVVMFALCDGSTRAISLDISPEVLRAIATPNGGEEVPIP
ncbi:MAG: DUF1559 domain-containing protein [Thermoguttaceae bacterium]